MLEIETFVLGPAATNTYLVADSLTGQAAVIDPAWDGAFLHEQARQRNWQIGQVWFTHAHFDHIGGAGDLARLLAPAPSLALHPADLPLWQAQGGAGLFGYDLPPAPLPGLALAHGMTLAVGELTFRLRHAPGHTPGLCLFHCAQAGVCFCGDLIFHHSVGRTDLPGGDWEQLAESIRSQVYTLPAETRLLPGHGRPTTVEEERCNNPFVRT